MQAGLKVWARQVYPTSFRKFNFCAFSICHHTFSVVVKNVSKLNFGLNNWMNVCPFLLFRAIVFRIWVLIIKKLSLTIFWAYLIKISYLLLNLLKRTHFMLYSRGWCHGVCVFQMTAYSTRESIYYTISREAEKFPLFWPK